jgi:hypothetical protein
VFSKDPQVCEVPLGRQYRFMYENFAILTQNAAYLLLETLGDSALAIKFDRLRECRYGGPNDEAHGAHPLAKYGLGAYGFFEVLNSPRIAELMAGNRIHPRHSDSLYSGLRHFIACFKEQKFECVCLEMQEVTLTPAEISQLLAQQLGHLDAAV